MGWTSSWLEALHKEVAWYVSSTPVRKRRYVASRLISRLQGPARLLAMSWNRGEFDAPDGTLTLLRKLAGSPLVRRTLPNTAAILQQYLSFRRRPNQSMANFLVRETLGYQEFSEVLTRLWGKRMASTRTSLTSVEDQWDWWHDDDGNEVDSPDGGAPLDDPPGDDAPAPTTTTTSASAAAGGNSGSAPPRAVVASALDLLRFAQCRCKHLPWP